MNRIERTFAELEEHGKRGLIPYVCAGAPEPDGLTRLLPALDQAGASVIEVGIPYSDPIADGPVIAASMHRALEMGMTPGRALEQVAQVRDQVNAGLVAMVSVSLVYAGGGAKFIQHCRDAGFDGFIFPDAPLESSGELVDAAREAGMTATLLIAPTTDKDRARAIAERCTGFIYMLARAGITGERDDAPEVEDRVRMVRDVTDVPIACGFGISNADHVRAVVAHADAAIVGSALVRRIDDAHERGGDWVEVAAGLVRDLAGGLPS